MKTEFYIEDVRHSLYEKQESPRHYLAVAYELASKYSDDPRTQNGAVIVSHGRIIGAGVNAFPKDVQLHSDRLVSPTKYLYMEHAERNAIFNAVRELRVTETELDDAVMYCPWFACADCARAIIACGIKRVVGHKQIFDKYGEGPWTESINAGNAMFAEAGVTCEVYSGEIGGVTILFNGERWSP